MALEALRLELLDSNNHAVSRPRSTEALLVDPAFEDASESSFPNQTVRSEVSGRISQFIETECLQIRGW